MWHITLPGIRPVIVLLLILQIGGILSVGFEQYQLQRDAVGWGATEVLDTYVYYRTILSVERRIASAPRRGCSRASSGSS